MVYLLSFNRKFLCQIMSIPITWDISIHLKHIMAKKAILFFWSKTSETLPGTFEKRWEVQKLLKGKLKHGKLETVVVYFLRYICDALSDLVPIVQF